MLAGKMIFYSLGHFCEIQQDAIQMGFEGVVAAFDRSVCRKTNSMDASLPVGNAPHLVEYGSFSVEGPLSRWLYGCFWSIMYSTNPLYDELLRESI